MLEVLVGSGAGLDVHRRQVVCTVIREGRQETREYGTFSRELKELPVWLEGEQVELAVMESTGIF